MKTKMYVVNFGYTGSASVMARSKLAAYILFKRELPEEYADEVTLFNIHAYDAHKVVVNYGDE